MLKHLITSRNLFSWLALVTALIASPSAHAMGKHAPKNSAPSQNPAASPPSLGGAALPSANPGASIFQAIQSGADGKTPFEALQSLFNAGTSTRIADLPSLDQCGKPGDVIARTLSYWVAIETKASNLTIDPLPVYVAKNLKAEISGPIPAQDEGPLFPVGSVTPEKDLLMPYFFGLASGCTEYLTPDEAKSLADAHYSLADAPSGATESTRQVKDDGVSPLQSSDGVFHSTDGIVVEQLTSTTWDDHGKPTTNVMYNYIWRESPSAQ